jgi:hypothetical protein
MEKSKGRACVLAKMEIPSCVERILYSFHYDNFLIDSIHYQTVEGRQLHGVLKKTVCFLSVWQKINYILFSTIIFSLTPSVNERSKGATSMTLLKFPYSSFSHGIISLIT